MTSFGQPTTSDTYPTRFREAERRSARIGRPLRLVAGVDVVDEHLMHRIGTALLARDEPGARLAYAMRMRVGEPGRVTHAQLRTALADGIEAVPHAPAALGDFIAAAWATPPWVDWELLGRGQRVFHRFGQNAADVLLQLSLIGGYRFGGPTDLLAATGGLTGDQTVRRLAETQYWTTTLAEPGGLRPGGKAWQLSLHVRAMHALVNETFAPRWDVDRWGQPINQADQAATLGLFDAVVLLGVRALGVPVSRADSRAVMHLWKYVGWVLGVDDQFLVDSEHERHRLNYHLLLAQADQSEAGRLLSQAIVDSHGRLSYNSFAGVRGWFGRERMLSMLTLFLGPRSMRELGLSCRPPWAHAYLMLLNFWRYRTPWGRARLDAWGTRVRDRVLRRYFGEEPPAVGRLG